MLRYNTSLFKIIKRCDEGLMMEKTNKTIIYSVVASETIHLFCCVLPTIFSVLSLLAGAGIITIMPSSIDMAHHIIHEYEIPMIFMSGIILAMGWGLYFYSRKISCRANGACTHKPCSPKKNRTRLFMIVATILFIVNISVYFIFHMPVDLHAHG